MIDTNELRRLTQAVSGWSNCNQAWLDQSEDVPAAVVGHIDEDGNTYPIATIDCDQYYAAHQSLPLAKFYAAANPAAISELLERLEAAESSADWHKRRWMALQIHQTKMREPERTMVCDILANGNLLHPNAAGDRYALPSSQPASSVPDDVMRDAKRYRFLRAAKNIPISTEAARDPVVYDAAIDAAMLAAAPEAKP